MPNSPPETRASLSLRLRNADDMAAWEEFAEVYGPVAFRVARRRGLQTADAENLVQEVLMAVAQSVSRWIERSDRGSFHAWLLRIAHNEAVNLLSLRATRPLGQDGEQGQQRLDEISIRNDISSLIDREYERELFRWAADRVQQTVAHHTWQAFWLTEVEGLSVQRVAETLGRSTGHIYVSRSRVMARIKALVQEYEAG
ncbi:MAG: sigma-70 family RNA polymerase sigma factor [Planctomycetota bacterium]